VPNTDFYESDLEQALITHLQKFILELGRGFSLWQGNKDLALMEGILGLILFFITIF
jgi:predicted nuclease of restriction endonuclease-like (RecB) superfamily